MRANALRLKFSERICGTLRRIVPLITLSSPHCLGLHVHRVSKTVTLLSIFSQNFERIFQIILLMHSEES